MSLFFGMDLTLLLGLRMLNFIFGSFLASVSVDYCLCEVPHESIIGSSSTNSTVTGGGRALSILDDFNEQCWMYQSAWTAVFLGLVVCQAIDMIWGLLQIISLLCNTVPTGAIVSTDTAWNCVCQCCVTLLNCLTCCTAGGFEAIGSTDTTDFASVCSDFFGDNGILDIAFSDILAGK